MTDQIIQNIKADFRKYLFQESLHRIEKCLNKLTAEEVWHKPNTHSNSMGVIVVHLMGNITQYIHSALGHEKDVRDRDLEFVNNAKLSKEELFQGIREVITKACLIVDQLTVNQVTKTYFVQGFEMSGLSIMMHVVEHCSYHVGQITYYTKLVKDIDTAYYGGMDLNQLNV
ncbi:MAG: DUF1572 family protein [Saprospiraceae bacterium]|nr:DUF1572 family protein [Saprospiraceae bacterium]